MATDFFRWSDDFSVGVAEIDGQHQTLVALINQLHSAIRERHGSKASREILDQLADYTRIHFLLEESLMRVSNYAGFAAHRAQHEELIKQVTALQEKLDSGSGAISFELLQFLLDWLTKHINDSDKRFGAYFNQSSRSGYAEWTQEVAQTMKRKWWRFW